MLDMVLHWEAVTAVKNSTISSGLRKIRAQAFIDLPCTSRSALEHLETGTQFEAQHTGQCINSRQRGEKHRLEYNISTFKFIVP